jgi:hypothetical protein
VLAVAAILLATGIGVLYVRLHDDALANCQAGNVTREQQEQLWDGFIAILAGPHPKPSVQPAERKILGSVEVTFAPVDCHARYPFW